MLFTPRRQEPLPFDLYVQGANNLRQFGAMMPQLPPDMQVGVSPIDLSQQFTQPQATQFPMNYGDVNQLQLPPDMQAGVNPIDLSQQLAQPQINVSQDLQSQNAQQQVAQPSKRQVQGKSGGVLSNFNDAMRTFVQSPLFTGLMNAARVIAASDEPKSDAYKEAVAAIFEGNQKAQQKQSLEQALIQNGFSPQEASVMASNKDAMNALIQLRQQRNTAQKYGTDIISADEKSGLALVRHNGATVSTFLPGSEAAKKAYDEYDKDKTRYTSTLELTQSINNSISQLRAFLQRNPDFNPGRWEDFKKIPDKNAVAKEYEMLVEQLRQQIGMRIIRETKETFGSLVGQITEQEHPLFQEMLGLLRGDFDVNQIKRVLPFIEHSTKMVSDYATKRYDAQAAIYNNNIAIHDAKFKDWYIANRMTPMPRAATSQELSAPFANYKRKMVEANIKAHSSYPNREAAGKAGVAVFYNTTTNQFEKIGEIAQ